MLQLLKFDLKKLFKKKLVTLFLISLIMSLFAFQKTSISRMKFFHSETSSSEISIYYNNIQFYLYDVEDSLKERIKQDFSVYIKENESIRLKELESTYSEKEILSLRLANSKYFKSLVDKYSIPLDK